MKRIFLCLFILLSFVNKIFSQPNFDLTSCSSYEYGLLVGADLPLTNFDWSITNPSSSVTATGTDFSMSSLFSPGAGSGQYYKMDDLDNLVVSSMATATYQNQSYTETILAISYHSPSPSSLQQFIGNYKNTDGIQGLAKHVWQGSLYLGITPPRPATFKVTYTTITNSTPQEASWIVPDINYNLSSSFNTNYINTITAKYYYQLDNGPWVEVVGPKTFSDGDLGNATHITFRAYGYMASANISLVKYSVGYISTSPLPIKRIPNFTYSEKKYCKGDSYELTLKINSMNDASAVALSLGTPDVVNGGYTDDILGDVEPLSNNQTITRTYSSIERAKHNAIIFQFLASPNDAPLFPVAIPLTDLPLPANAYSAVANDMKGCPGAKGSIIFQPGTLPSATFTYAFALNDTATFSANTQSDISNAGTYQPYYKAIRDGNSYCYALSPVTVSDKRVSDQRFTVTPTDATCYGSNGMLKGTLANSVANPTLFKMTIQGNSDVAFNSSYAAYSSLPASVSDYIVNLKYNDVACTHFFDKTAHINQPAPLSLSIQSVNVANFGGSTGSVSYSITGGTSSYTVTLFKGTSKIRTINSSPATGVFSSLSAGTYTISVTDSHSCSITSSSIDIKQPSSALSLSVTGHTDVACNGGSNGSITLNGSGGWPPLKYSSDGTTYQVSNVLTGLSAGTYTLYVKDAMDVVVNVGLSITQPTALIPSIIKVTDLCSPGASNGSIAYSITGGVSPYSISISPTYAGIVNSNNIFSGLKQGVHTITVTDNNGCSESVIANVQEPSAPLSTTATPTDETLCPSFSNGEISVTASGGWGNYTYLLDGKSVGLPPFNSLASGQHTVQVTDGKGCSLPVINVNVGAATTPVVNVTIKHPCEGQTNGWIYPSVDSWSGPALSYTSSMPSGATASISAGSKFENLAAYSSYSLNLLINGSVCPSAAKVVDLKAFAPPAASGFVYDSASCASASNGAMSFTISGNAGGSCSAIVKEAGGKTYSYSNLINGLSNKIAGLPGGTYSMQITDTAQCSYTIPLISLPISSKAVTISSLTSTAPICHGEANGTIAVSGGSGFGDWIVSIKDSLLADVVTDNIPRLDSLFDKTYGNLTAGDYTVSISDTSNCSVSELVTVPQKAPIAFTVTKIRYVTTAQSSDGSLDYLVSGGNGHFKVTLQNPPAGAVVAPGKFSNLPAGTYTVQIKDSLNMAYCNAEQTFTIKAPQAPLIIVGANPQQPKCYASTNGSVTLNVTGGWGGYKYSKDSISWQSSSTIAGLTAGSYKFWVVDSLGAIKDTTIVLGQPEAIAVTPPVITDVSCNGAVMAQ